MEPKVLKTEVASYEVVAWTGANTSSIKPMSDKVLILPDTVRAQTRGGIHITQTQQEQQNLGAESGVLVDLGPEAFRFSDSGRPWVGDKPQIGSHVYFERYAGQKVSGRDGQAYRLMDAKCIGALVVDEELVA